MVTRFMRISTKEGTECRVEAVASGIVPTIGWGQGAEVKVVATGGFWNPGGDGLQGEPVIPC